MALASAHDQHWAESLQISPAALPFDVLEVIGKFLWNNREPLSSPTLTARLWYAAMRPYIYRSVSLRSKDHSLRLRDLIQANPVIGQWIHEIRVTYSRRYIGVRIQDWFLDLPSMLDPTTLGNLHTISFRGQEAWHGDDDLSHAAIQYLHRFSAFEGVHTLSFMDCILPYDFAKAIISAVPNLRVLHMHSVMCSRSHPRVEFPHLFDPTQLHSIQVHADNRSAADGFSPDLLVAPASHFAQSLGALKTLHFHFGANTTSLLEDLAKIVFPVEKSSVEHLELYFPNPPGCSVVVAESCNKFIIENIDVSMFSQLRTLHIRGLHSPSTLLSILNTISSPHITHLTFGIPSSSLTSPKAREFANVDIALTTEKMFEKVQDVHCFVYDTVTENVRSARRKVEVLFPVLAERGMLRVSLVGDPDRLCDWC